MQIANFLSISIGLFLIEVNANCIQKITTTINPTTEFFTSLGYQLPGIPNYILKT